MEAAPKNKDFEVSLSLSLITANAINSTYIQWRVTLLTFWSGFVKDNIGFVVESSARDSSRDGLWVYHRGTFLSLHQVLYIDSIILLLQYIYVRFSIVGEWRQSHLLVMVFRFHHIDDSVIVRNLKYQGTPIYSIRLEGEQKNVVLFFEW